MHAVPYFIWLSRRLRAAMSVADFASRSLPAYNLSRRDRHRTIRRRRPDEPSAVQTLGVKRHSDPVMPQDLGQIAAATAEYEEIAAMGITLETLLNLKRQPLHAAPHVGMPSRNPDPDAARNRNHRRESAFTTRVSAAVSTSAQTMI